jgi:signal peptidase II
MHHRYFWSLSILFSTILVDQLSKRWASEYSSSLYFNQGFFLGLYSDLPESLRIVALSALAGLLLFLYAFVLFILPITATLFKYGLSLFVGGIFGNVLDKIRLGSTVDFIPIHLGDAIAVFNLADVLQWIGLTLSLWVLFRRDRLIWFPDSSRQTYLIKPREQVKVGFQFALLTLLSSLAMGLFTFAFIQSTGDQSYLRGRVLIGFGLTYLLLTSFISFLAFVLGLIISHRSLGALFAFEQYCHDLMMGKDRPFKLRKNDQFQHLQTLAERLREFITVRK